MSTNMNSDTWIEEQFATRGLERTPENRRQLMQEYYEVRPYAKADEEARQKRKTAQPEQTSEEQVRSELGIADSAVLGQTTSPYTTAYVFPSRRVAYNSGNISRAEAAGHQLRSVRTPQGIISYYDQDLLVNEDNDIARPQYDAGGADVLSEYASIINPVERSAFLTTLKDYLFYGDDKPSDLAMSGRGLESKDERAIQAFLNYSSGQGRTWRAMLPIIQGTAKIAPSGGSGRRVSVVSTEDATRIFREESLRLLGRMPTQQEIRAAVSTIQSQQRSRGAGGSMDAPSVTTAAQEQAKQAAPGERAAQSAGQAINQIFALLGGR